MAKLVYIDQSLTNAQIYMKNNSSNTNWDNNGNLFYRALVFTKDGHLLTHGLDFSSAASWGVGLIYNQEQGKVSSTAPKTGGKTFFPTYKSTLDASGNVTSVEVGWIDTSTLLTTGGSSTITTVGTITSGIWNASTITVPYGGTGATSFTSGGVLYGNGTGAIQATSQGTSSQVLVGGTTPTWRSIISSIDLTHTASVNNSLVTEAAVASAIAAAFAANDAMVFKGITGAPTTDGIAVGTLTTDSAGYTWKVGTAGYFNPTNGKIYSASATGRQKVEVGDLIICISDGKTVNGVTTNATYGVVQTNIENPLSYANLGGTSSGLTRQVQKDSNNYLFVSQLMRPVSVGGTSKISSSASTTLDFSAGTGLTVEYVNNSVRYKISDISGLSAVTTAGIYKIKYNAQGQITGTSAWNPNTINILNGGNQLTNGNSTNIIYDPDGTGLVFNFVDGIQAVWDSTNSRVKIGHSSTGATKNKTNSGRTYIQSLTIDSWGHVTGISTATENVVNTWRPVYAWKTADMNKSGDTIDLALATGTGTRGLAFSSTFGWVEKTVKVGSTDTNVTEIDLVWAEVSSTGVITYVS